MDEKKTKIQLRQDALEAKFKRARYTYDPTCLSKGHKTQEKREIERDANSGRRIRSSDWVNSL